MPHSECQRCGGNIRPVTAPGERVPELRCHQCGHEYKPPPPPPPPPTNYTNAAAQAAIADRVEPRRVKVAALYQQGVIPLAIAQQLGVPRSTIYADLKRLGMAPGKRRISPAQVKRIVTMRQAGMTNAEIQRATGSSHLTVMRHTARAGLPTRSTQMTDAKRTVFRLYRTLRPLGWSYRRIGDRAGVSRATVHRWITDAGLRRGDARASNGRRPKAAERFANAPKQA